MATKEGQNAKQQQSPEASHWVDELLMEAKEQAGRIRSMPKVQQRRELQRVGAQTLNDYDRWFLSESVRAWVKKQQHPSEAVYDAIDALLGSEVLEQEDATDEQIDTARRGRMDMPFAPNLLEMLQKEGISLLQHERNQDTAQLLKEITARARNRVAAIMKWREPTVRLQRWTA